MITTRAWKNSSTTAHVALEIYGSEGKSGILQLSQEEPGAVHTLFSRGNSDVFVLYVNKSLGSIQRRDQKYTPAKALSKLKLGTIRNIFGH